MINSNSTAIEIHEFLSKKLNSNWLEFMESAFMLIPSLNHHGRIPTNKINESFLAGLNFSSWKSYITASKRKGGLGWSVNGWNNYRRAYNLIKLYPYLRDMNFSAGWINNFSSHLKKQSIQFPNTADEFWRLKENFAASKENQKDDHISALQAALDAEKNKNQRLRIEIAKRSSFDDVLRHISDIENLNHNIAIYKNTISNLGFLDGVKLLFGCQPTITGLKKAKSGLVGRG